MQHYFRAFDYDNSNSLDIREVMSGLIAMDPIGNRSISSKKMWLEHRLRMIFRVYDYRPPIGELDLEEFTDLMRHILRASGQSSDPTSVQAAVHAAAPRIGSLFHSLFI